MKAQTIADVLCHNLTKLNKTHVGITPVSPNYERLQRVSERINENVNKCSCTIGEKEFSGKDVRKIKLPNISKPQWEVMTASSNAINGRLVLEIKY